MTRVTRKKSGHLIEIVRDDGTRDVSWDWKQLLADVNAACEAYEAANKGKKLTVDGHGDVHEVKAKTPAAKKAPAKKPAAKKPAAKKPAAKKPAAKKPAAKKAPAKKK